MKKILILFLVSFLSAFVFGQKFQDALLYGKKENRLAVGSFIGIPTGCGAPAMPNAIEQATGQGALYIDDCGHYVFVWDPDLASWDTLISTTAITGSTAWGTLVGDINAQTDLIDLLNAKVSTTDLTTTLAGYITGMENLPPLFNTSIVGGVIVPEFEDAPARTFFGGHSGVTGQPEYISWDSISTSALTFSSGLLRTGNSVVALNEQAIWNANFFQDYPIQSGTPDDGDTWVFNLSEHEWQLAPGGGGGTTLYSGNGTVADATRNVDLYSNLSLLNFYLSSDNQNYFTIDAQADRRVINFQSQDNNGVTTANVIWGFGGGGIFQNTTATPVPEDELGFSNGTQQYTVTNQQDAPGNFTTLAMNNSAGDFGFGEWFWLTVNGEGGVGVRGDFSPGDGTSSLTLYGTNVFTQGNVDFGFGSRVEQGYSVSSDADYTVNGSGEYLIISTGNTVDRAINLPDIAGAVSQFGRRLLIKSTDAVGGNCIITAFSGQTIEGNPTMTLSGIQAVELVCFDSSKWSILNFFPD